jgi:hypothetical protein
MKQEAGGEEETEMEDKRNTAGLFDFHAGRNRLACVVPFATLGTLCIRHE